MAIRLLTNEGKLKLCRFFLVFVFGVVTLANASYRDGDYTVPVFRVNQQPLTIARTDVIKSEKGQLLVEIDSLPDLKTGQLILRRKTGNRFAFFKGELDTSAFGKKPVVYTFPIPSSTKLSEFIQYRIYNDSTDKIGSDQDDVYFDEEHIFVKHHPKIFFHKDNTWFSLQGSVSLPFGAIEIYTDPTGAQVIIDGIKTGEKTPCTFSHLLSGIYSFELILPGYHIFQKSVRIFPSNTVTAAFELLSDMDTIYISGKAPYGVLILPQTPTDSLYRIDSNRIFSLKTRLKPGVHRLQWNGGMMYESIDTTITIKGGTVNYLDYEFKRRFGVMRIIPSPSDAEVCIQGMPCRVGEQVLEMPTGDYAVSAFHLGFRNLKKNISVFPDTIVLCEMDLTQMPDRDADGFVDSVDECPDRYGLFGGCPRMKIHEALKVKRDELINYVQEDPFSITASFLSTIVRVPVKKQFSNFLSNFTGTRIGGINNYRGLALANSYAIQFRGLYAGLELGQWVGGLKYLRNDTLKISTKHKEYKIFYDSFNSVNPVMFIPSTAINFGFHYGWSWINLNYSIGYQWEDIIVDQVYNVTDDIFERMVMNNDWWFHMVGVEANFNADGFVVPSVYAKVKLPFANSGVTRWLVMQTGIQVKLVPSHKRKF